MEIWFGIANGQISSNFDGVLCLRCAHIFVSGRVIVKGILIKLDTCIHIKEILFGIADGQILSIFDRVTCPQHSNGGILSFYDFIAFQ